MSTSRASQLDDKNSVWQEISGGQDLIKVGNYETPSRGYVGRFNFSGTQQQQLIGELSGGERNRVHLAKVLKTGGNVLLLDEPTNDLDIETLRALEEALLAFPGCAVVISHDRWFLDRIATHILAFEGESQVVFFEGNYQEYAADYARRTRRGRHPAASHQVQEADPMTAAARPPGVAGAWAPLRHREFALLWGAGLVSNIGSWMHDLAAGWFMTTLDSTPFMVALVQAASTLPVCLLALPAGTLADRMDKRQLLLLVQIVMLLLAALLGTAGARRQASASQTAAGRSRFGMGVCTAVMSPTWQSIIPRLVPPQDLQPAVALHAVGMNISRAIGPAIGGPDHRGASASPGRS